MLLTQAKGIMDEVRSFFAKGHKSNNKKYYVDLDEKENQFEMAGLSPSELQRAINRNQQADESLKHRPAFSGDYEELAEDLIHMPLAQRSGNCMEMAALSARCVLERTSTAADRVYIAAISAPSDHAFCLIDQRSGGTVAMPNFPRVRDFVAHPQANRWMIIDPWLHVVCTANQYLVLGAQKLQKWGAAGKRIYWGDGPVGEGFYSPVGAYQMAFARAPIDFEDYA